MVHSGYLRHSPFFLGKQIKAVFRLKIILWQKNTGSCKEIWTRKFSGRTFLNLRTYQTPNQTADQWYFTPTRTNFKTANVQGSIHFIYHQWGKQKEHTATLYPAKTAKCTFMMQLLCCSNLVAKQPCNRLYYLNWIYTWCKMLRAWVWP